jgi:hypothetical protein
MEARIRNFGGKEGETTMTEYRKVKRSDTWHYCKNCSKWPTYNYDSQYTKPTSGELCDECRAKEANKNCST